MTNIYFLWKGGTPPSPYSKWTGGDGNYVRFTNNVNLWGQTGGSASHTHNSSGATCGNSTTCGYYWSGGSGGTYMKVHTHTLSFSITASNNDPSYYQYEVIYCDLNTWETLERSLPAGTVVISDTALSWPALTRETGLDNRLVKLGTAGLTGGRDNHNHPVSVTLTSTNPSQAGVPYSSYSSVSSASHSHTGSLTTPDKTIKPARIQTRLYSIPTATDRVEAGIIAFVDGVPSANWAPLDWNDSFLESVNQNAAATGVNSHDHLNLSLTSSTYSRGTTGTGGDSTSTACNNHYHNVSFSLDSQSFLPPYVYLYPVKLNTTLYHINTYTAAHVEDMVLKRVYDSSTTNNTRLKAAGYEFIIPDILLKKPLDYGLLHDTMMAKRLTVSVDHNAIIEAWNHRSLLSSLRLMYTTAAISAGVRLIQPHQTSVPVLDSILKAWTTQLDKIQMRIATMDLSNKLDYATDSEIDLKWGAVYNLLRFSEESDEHYRKRIKTYTMIQTGSGTKEVCEAVLDKIVDESGASRVETREPGKVRIYWDSNKAPCVASERMDVIEYTVPTMLAAGIEWEMLLEYIELPVVMNLQGSDYIYYYIDMLLQSKDRYVEYYVRPRLITRFIEELIADAILKGVFSETFLMNLRAQQGFTRSFVADGRLRKSCNVTLTIDLLERANPVRAYRMSQLLNRPNIYLELEADSLLKRLFRRTLYMELIAVFQSYLDVQLDTVLQRYDINKLFPLDALFKKGTPTAATVDLILVSA